MFAALRFDDIGMTFALEIGLGGVLRGQQMCIGIGLIGAEHIARTRHSHGVLIAGPAFCGQQPVIAVASIEMRAFGQLVVRIAIDVANTANQSPFGGRIFLADDTAELVATCLAMVPDPPPESGLPRISSWAARVHGGVASRQFARSRESWICTPGYHSKVAVAM